MKRLIAAGLVSIATLTGAIGGTGKASAEVAAIVDAKTPSQGCDVVISTTTGRPLSTIDRGCIVSVLVDGKAQGTMVTLPELRAHMMMTEFNGVPVQGYVAPFDQERRSLDRIAVFRPSDGRFCMAGNMANGDRISVCLDVNEMIADTARELILRYGN